MTVSTEEIEFGLLLEAICQRHHYDFRGYASASLLRRLVLARQRFGCATFSQLQDRVLREPEIMPELLGYLTVQVSEMFRDPSYFRTLRELVVPYLRTYPSLKVWVAGCANGEELYSLAILFREEGLEDRTLFYATEINPEALRRAELGIYDRQRIALFTENHRRAGGRSSLSDYYTAAYGAARFDKSLRARTVFADHSLVSDEVFAEMHLICCRNVLIYFDRELQDRALSLFSRSLARGGFLGLGASETLRFSSEAGSFADFEPTERLYRKLAPSPAHPESSHAIA